MRRQRFVAAAVLVAGSLLLTGLPGAAAQEEPLLGSAVEESVQSERDAIRADSDTLSKQLGVSVAEVERTVRIQHAFAELVDAAGGPDEFAWYEAAPVESNHGGRLVVLAERALDFDDTKFAALNVEVSFDGVRTLSELRGEALQLAVALRAARDDWAEFSVSPARHDRLTVTVTETELASFGHRSSEAVAALSRDGGFLLDADRIAVEAEPDEHFAEMSFDGLNGGSSLNFDTDPTGTAARCTTAFAAYPTASPVGSQRGYLTAGHCWDQGTSNTCDPPRTCRLRDHFSGATRTVNWIASDYGYGDWAFFRTPVWEGSRFFSEYTKRRGANSYMPVPMENQYVCNFGRNKPNDGRTCHIVEDAWDIPPGVSLWAMVRTTGDTTGPGDSGGPWFHGWKAYGIHSGSNGSNTWYTPIHVPLAQFGLDLIPYPV